jgi:RNA polymerase sigma-70 factor (ECF subfamily)
MNASSDESNLDDPIGQTSFLARRLIDGDRGVFQDLYDRLAPGLFAWTNVRIRGTPAACIDPQDILQEVWLRALNKVASYDPARSFRSWMFGIAKNVLLESYRKASTETIGKGSNSSTKQELEHFDCPASVTTISQRLAKDEAVQSFLAYVDKLDPEDRMLVLYCGFEEYTIADAALRLGISADAAMKRWQRVRARLRDSGLGRLMALTGTD